MFSSCTSETETCKKEVTHPLMGDPFTLLRFPLSDTVQSDLT